MKGFVNPTPWVPNNQKIVMHAKNRRLILRIIALIVSLLVGAAIAFAVIYPQMSSRINQLNSSTAALQGKNVKLKNSLDAIKTQLDGATQQSGSGESTADTNTSTGKVGDAEENTGIKMQLVSVSDAATINYDTCGDGCSNGVYAPKSPDSGTKYWLVNVVITNTGKQPIDISCSYPLSIKAINTESQQYSPIDSLYQVQGNPGCNADLQPGLTEKVTYPFVVPSSAHMIGIVWYGVDENATSTPANSYFITDSKYTLSDN
ncbi:hypothetical protein [Bifidobacterium aquikefiri]|uniref:hypothetical protein n=1 Tax=Bifidobacterium aquikefiri TaxID=1653207 RepID=UPI0023F3C422|nr:hypothetical protein [Bifidobacterium aquikefiri]